MSSYGERLMRARKEKELSREELGKLCGITGRTIQNYELGHVTPNRIDVSQRLADVLSISVDYLIYGEKEETELTEEDKKEILAHASALFAGGKLSDEEQLAFIYELQTLYMKARQIIKDSQEQIKQKAKEMSKENCCDCQEENKVRK